MNEFRKRIELTEEQKKEIERKQYEKHKQERNKRVIENPIWEETKRRMEGEER